ncbi:MAG: NAD(P)/FAD-dependent oxidoreductase [Pseudomonadota bacterium]
MAGDAIGNADTARLSAARSDTQSRDVDVAIIGGGHNGLVTAAYLARAGLSCTVFEKNDVFGGAAITEEFAPGFRNSVASYTVSLLNPKVIADLGLEKHGLRIVERPVANFWPVDDERGLVMPYGLEARQAAIRPFSERDAERLPAYDAALERAASVLRTLVLKTPPSIGGGLAGAVRAFGAGAQLAGLSTADKRLVTNLFTRSAADVLDTWFENPTVKAAFAFDGIVGAFASPSTPGTAYVLLHHCFGEVNGKPGVWGHAIGGMGAISASIASAARSAGARIETGSAVREITTGGSGRATGVILDDGRRISARAVASNVGPKLLFRDLVPESAIDADVRDAFLNMRTGSGTFRMNVALSELPNFTCRPGTNQQAHHGAGIIIGPTLEYLETAYFDARRDGWSHAPVVEMLIPSTLDDMLAPPGQHVASLFVQHVQPHLPNGRNWSSPAEKERFADVVIETLGRHAPNLPASVIARQVLSPLDLETRFGLVDGDIFHGQLGLDQLFATRPVLGHSDYRMPLDRLYLCGSGAHPGGGVTGAPGHNAAREIIRDLRRANWLAAS